MPNGLHPDRPDKNLIERSLRELADQDKKLAAVMSDEIRLIGKERKKLNETKQGEVSRLKKSGLDPDTVDAKLAALENFYAKNSARLDKRLVALQDRLIDDLEDQDQSRFKKRLEKEQREKVENIKEKKQFYKELRVNVSDAVGDGMKEASVKTFDTLLGPFKLITKPIEELTGKSMSDLLGNAIESRQEKRRETRNERIGYGRGGDMLGNDAEDEVDLPPEEPGLLGAPVSTGALPAPVSLESIDESASLRVHVDNWDGMVDAVRGTGTSGFGYELLPDEEPGALGPPAEAPGMLGAPVAPLALPSPEMLDARLAGADDSSRDESAMIDKLRPRNINPTRPEMLHDGLIGAQAVYITDTLLGKEGPPGEKEKKGGGVGDIIGGLLGADAIKALIKSAIPALILALPEILAAATVAAIIAAIVDDTSKRNKEKETILAGIPDEELAKKGIKKKEIVNLEQAKAAQAVVSGKAGTTVDISSQGAVEQLMGAGNKTGRALTTAALEGAATTGKTAETVLGDFTKGGYYFWRDQKTGEFWASKNPADTKQSAPLPSTFAGDIEPINTIVGNAAESSKDKKLRSLLYAEPEIRKMNFLNMLDEAKGKPVRFDRGGEVPGRVGEPQLVQAEGGETFVPTHDRKFRDNLDVMLDSTMTRGTPLDRHVASMNKNEPLMIDDTVNDRVVDALRELINVVKSQQRRPQRRLTEPAGAGPDLDSLRLGG